MRGIHRGGRGEFTAEGAEITEIGQGGILEGARRVHRRGRNTLPYTDPLDTGLRRYDVWAGVARRRVHHRGRGGGLSPLTPALSRERERGYHRGGRGGVHHREHGEHRGKRGFSRGARGGSTAEGATSSPGPTTLDTGLRRYDGWAGVAQPPPCRRAQKFREGLNLWGCQCRVLGTI